MTTTSTPFAPLWRRLLDGEHTWGSLEVAGVHDVDVVTAHHRFQALAHRLLRADALLGAGDITVAEHEAAVWDVYDRLEGKTTPRTGN